MKEKWQNPKSRSAIILSIWLVFILIVIILSAIGSPKRGSDPINQENNTNADISKEVISKAVDTLFKDKISYKITYEKKDLSEKKVFDLTYEDKIYEGFVEDNLGIMKFHCDLVICYKLSMDHEEELEDYLIKEEIDIMKIKSIKDKLKLDKNNNYIYEQDNITYRVLIKDNKVNKIIYETEDYTTIFDVNYNH